MPDGYLAKALQGTGREDEGAEALVGTAKVLMAYKDAIPENAIALLAKCAGQGNSTEAQIYSKARAMVAKDGDLTFEEAVEKVMDLEPELYEKAEEEREERAAKRRGK